MENLRYIRETMSRAGEFTGVPGWGGVARGVTAVAAAAISGPPDNSLRWVLIWLAEAAVASLIALAAMTIKARRSGSALWTSSRGAPAYRFALAYAPPLVAGFVLTPVFAAADLLERLAWSGRFLCVTVLAVAGLSEVAV